MATESGGDETGDETGGPGGPRDETGDKTVATDGEERDGGNRWGNVYGRRSIYITPPVTAVSFVTSRRRRLVAGLVPGTAGFVHGLVSAGLCRYLPLL